MNNKVKIVICICLLFVSVNLALANLQIYKKYKSEAPVKEETKVVEKKEVKQKHEEKTNDLDDLDTSLQAFLEEYGLSEELSYCIQDLETGHFITYNEGVVQADGNMYRLGLCVLFSQQINASQDYTDVIETVDLNTLASMAYQLGVSELPSGVSEMKDALYEIYTHQDTYPTLIESMERVDHSRLSTNWTMNGTSEDYSFNTCGISLDGHPYSISIYSMYVNGGEFATENMNQICFEYFNK